MPLYNPPASSSGSAPPISPNFFWGGAPAFSSAAGSSGPFNGITAAVAIYLGYTTGSFTPANLRFYQGAVASGGSLQGFLASSSSAPDGSGKTLTVLDFVSGPSLTSGTGWKTCTGWSQTIASGVHLWAGVKVASTSGSSTFLNVNESGTSGFLQALFSGVPTLSVGATIGASAQSSIEMLMGLRIV